MTTCTCEHLYLAAERELGAFLQAITLKFGKTKVDEACEMWLQALEGYKTEEASAERLMRRITILASSRMADRHAPASPRS